MASVVKMTLLLSDEVYRMSFEQRTVELNDLESETANLAELPVFHGTPVSSVEMGQFIEPRQSMTRNYQGSDVPHGLAAVSLSACPYPFPIVRSLLNQNHPLLAERTDRDLVLAIETDCHSRPYYFVGAVVLKCLVDNNGSGSVYGCEGYGNVVKFPHERLGLDEYRAKEQLPWLLVAQTKASDLPDFLHVIGGSKQQIWDYLDVLPHNEDPYGLAGKMRVPLMSMREWRSSGYLS